MVQMVSHFFKQYWSNNAFVFIHTKENLKHTSLQTDIKNHTTLQIENLKANERFLPQNQINNQGIHFIRRIQKNINFQSCPLWNPSKQSEYVTATLWVWRLHAHWYTNKRKINFNFFWKNECKGWQGNFHQCKQLSIMLRWKVISEKFCWQFTVYS